MIISRKLFLKTLFMFNLLMLNGALHQHFEELNVRYTSNDQGIHEVILILKHKDNSLVINYGSGYGALYIDLILKNGFKPKIKAAQLLIDDSNINNKEYIQCCNYDFYICREKWDKLLIKANGNDLYFSIICVEEKTNIEREYCFKVSAVNLRKFIDSCANFF